MESGLSSVVSDNRGRLANSPTRRLAISPRNDRADPDLDRNGTLAGTMCGRYVINEDAGTLADYFGVDRIATDPLAHSHNVAPTDEVYGVAEHRGSRMLGVFRWGLIPHWARDRKGPLNINARAETVATRPAFRDSLRRKRCILPAGGFFEWTPKDEGRRPYYITMADHRPMAFAGMWSSWRDPETREWIRSCAIITTRANSALAPIHTRMPVILEQQHWDLWLDRDIRSPEAVAPMLTTIPSALVTHQPVSTLVNSVRNNSPQNIAPSTDLD